MTTRRCSVCAINWAPHDDFQVCERCGEETEVQNINAVAGDRALTQIESLRLRSRLRGERAREVAEVQAARAQRLAPVISSAVASLKFDLAKWAGPEGAAFVAEEGERSAL